MYNLEPCIEWCITTETDYWTTGYIPDSTDPTLPELWQRVDVATTEGFRTTRMAVGERVDDVQAMALAYYWRAQSEAKEFVWPVGESKGIPHHFHLEMDALTDAEGQASELFETVFEGIGATLEAIGFILSVMMTKKVRWKSRKVFSDLFDQYFLVVQTYVKETVGDVSDRFKAITNWKDKEGIVDAVASEHLGFKFGIEPLISEYQELKKTLEHMKQAEIWDTAVKVFETRDEAEKYTFQGSSRESELHIYRERDISCNTRVKLHVRVHQDTLSKSLRVLDYLGLSPSFSRVWQVVPMSFAINWVTPMKDFLQKVDHAHIKSRLWDIVYKTVSSEYSMVIETDTLDSYFDGALLAVYYKRFSSLNWSRPNIKDIEAGFLSNGVIPIALSLGVVLSSSSRTKRKLDKKAAKRKTNEIWKLLNQTKSASIAKGAK
jgi:hypothetical protein